MGGRFRNLALSSNVEENRGRRVNDERGVVHCSSKPFSHAYKSVASLSQRKSGSGAVGQLAMFLLKVAAIEAVRRVSRSKCPPLWNGIQGLQFLCYPPFRWIGRWAPFKGLISGLQMFSKPLLVVSVATAISDQLDGDSITSDSVSRPHTHSEPQSDSLSVRPSNDISDGFPPSLESENWLSQLHKELEQQGIALPERLNEDELQRFYTAANSDLSSLLPSIKKTIRWRETYRILSEDELEMWSNTVFWHGVDVQDRPCLIVRIGLACSNLPSQERPRFAQAVISQIDHRILHLVDGDNPNITVILDCDGISPLRIPMQILRSCFTHLQDNFPNRLGNLIVIRLPPVVRVIAQTFIQVLKPVTRKKLRIEGNMYRGVLSKYLQTLPAYLGGDCDCKICSGVGFNIGQQKSEQTVHVSDGREVLLPHLTCETDVNVNDDHWDCLVKTAVIGILMIWALIALVSGIIDPASASRPV